MTLNTELPHADTIRPVDVAWIETASYETLWEHFAVATVRNKYHLGDTGRFFSKMVDKKRAELTPEKVAEIDARIHKIAINPTSTIH